MWAEVYVMPMGSVWLTWQGCSKAGHSAEKVKRTRAWSYIDIWSSNRHFLDQCDVLVFVLSWNYLLRLLMQISITYKHNRIVVAYKELFLLTNT
jgi:hypothetical protein